MKIDLKKIATFGIAGNFTGHLEQAGEASDFKNIKTDETNAPKAIFPTYIPYDNNFVPDFLKVFPFSSNKIVFPKNQENLQIEPECAIIFDVEWNDNKITNIIPRFFASSNDCSIRKEGAKKISLKKNWGANSKGLSDNLIPIDKFCKGGILDNYRIACFLLRNNEFYEYGENSLVKNYSYIYQKLLDWCLDKLNNQKDEGPTEEITKYLLGTKISQIMISIGATRYTEFGKTNFLKNNDESIVVLYPENKYSGKEIKNIIKESKTVNSDISLLRQKVVLR